MKLVSYAVKLLGDLVSPPLVYLRLREHFSCSCLLESSDYRGVENSRSFIGVMPLASVRVKDGVLYREILSEPKIRKELSQNKNALVNELNDFLEGFDYELKIIKPDQEGSSYFYPSAIHPSRVSFSEVPFSGLFGYMNYDAVQYFENIKFNNKRDEEREIFDASYSLFRYIIQINHFKSELYITRNVLPEIEMEGQEEDEIECSVKESLKSISRIIFQGRTGVSSFRASGERTSNFTDKEHIEIIEKCKKHIQRGDIFQIVPSRRFSQNFSGDDFLVYRALRAINPSPYLFYFDLGDYRLFGSSPEALLTVSNGRASSYPIAGTVPRTGDSEVDGRRANELLLDPKENSEHVMLVDLARNDLSRFCTNVSVPVFREVQNYSHVIHLVSRVDGIMDKEINPFQLLQATLPAGTLSGAPKYRAMELIDSFERGNRGYYAGAVGTVGFSRKDAQGKHLPGELNHAIMIRSLLSKNNTLFSQAGGGIVAESDPDKEVEEVKSKLEAIRYAIRLAEEISSEHIDSLTQGTGDTK
ncbi:MAG TPA: anthranilate synthase component I family protein [Oligoflexia bacterium]|nr:anthranilate synthase component I family protein [Oligoflexia bacterium]HMP48176.1 anthranilate synthase component I family protein [Oligoflexia bacterium]